MMTILMLNNMSKKITGIWSDAFDDGKSVGTRLQGKGVGSR